jgi:16S rRNA (cytidine1402-2'-O)-methyltransferase
MDADRSEEAVSGPARLAAGLYVVATPIGAARDITLRALDILGTAEVLAAEDTRSLQRLMEIHGIRRAGRELLAYHDHNAAAQRPRLLAAVAAGRSVALVSDAGTPLVADPGFKLVAEAVAQGLPVWAAPGASALLAALAVAGLPTDRFLFAGFPPPKAGLRARMMGELAAVPATLVFYESPRRLAASLAAMAEALGPDRPAAVCRELTKRFEEVRRGDHAQAVFKPFWSGLSGGDRRGVAPVL